MNIESTQTKPFSFIKAFALSSTFAMGLSACQLNAPFTGSGYANGSTGSAASYTSDSNPSTQSMPSTAPFSTPTPEAISTPQPQATATPAWLEQTSQPIYSPVYNNPAPAATEQPAAAPVFEESPPISPENTDNEGDYSPPADDPTNDVPDAPSDESPSDENEPDNTQPDYDEPDTSPDLPDTGNDSPPIEEPPSYDEQMPINHDPVIESMSVPSNLIVSKGATAYASLSASASDSDGNALNLNWYEGSRHLGSGNQIQADFIWGNHEIRVEVSDGNGGTASRTMYLQVQESAIEYDYVLDVSQSSQGGGTWESILNLSATLVDGYLEVRAAKNSGNFSSDQFVELKVGSYETWGVNWDTDRIYAGSSAVVLSKNLRDINDNWPRKEIWIRSTAISGGPGYSYAGPLVVRRIEREVIR